MIILSNIIKNIHSQLKPDKTTKTQLIEQIRNGRVPELKKGSGSAMGAVAAVAVVAVLAGVFALNNAGNKLEKDTASPDNASGITTTVNDPEVTSATTTTAERTSDNFSAEDLKIEFTDISWWNTVDNPYVSQEKISISQKMKVIFSNREIEWYDNTYTALDSSFEKHANANEVGAYIAFGEFTVDGEKHYAAMCRANGYSDQQRIMISLGDNMYYVFENADYDYDDIRMADFTIGNYRIEDFPEAEEIYEFDADIILPKVIQKIGNNTGLLSEFDPAPRVIDRIGKKNYTIETVSENDEEYIFDPAAPVPVIMQIYMSGKDYIMLGEVNKIKNTDDLLAVFEGDKKEYRLRFTNSFILHDNTPAIHVDSYKGSFKMNIAGDKKAS